MGVITWRKMSEGGRPSQSLAGVPFHKKRKAASPEGIISEEAFQEPEPESSAG